jgi:hypothetical protein
MSRENVTFVCSVLLGILVLFTVGLSRPDLLVEDQLVESLGAFAFAAASVLALSTALRKHTSLSPIERKALAGTSLLCLVLFLSEISFGARLFGLQMPTMRGGGQFDGGHDIVIVIFRILRDAGYAGALIAAAGALLVLTLVGVFLYWYRQKLRSVLDRLLLEAFEFRLALAVALLASAVTLDLLTSYKAAILEEVLEFVASGVFILAIQALPRTEKKVAGSGLFHGEGAGVIPGHRSKLFD